MTLLLDAHAFLWFCQDDPALSQSARSKHCRPTIRIRSIAC